MNPKEYIKNVLKTESSDFPEIGKRLNTVKSIRLLHGSIGVATESGELLDAIKKHLFYGKPLDEVNLKEEIADCLWYISVMLDELDSSFEEVMETNIEKLKARYGDKFNEEGAVNRDLKIEREILEK